MLDQLVDDTSGAVMRLIAKNPRVMILMGAIPDQSQVIKLVMNKQFAGRWQDDDTCRNSVRHRTSIL